MPQRLREFIRNGDWDGFETRCLELLETGTMPLKELADCFGLMEQAGQTERVPPLVQMVFENVDPAEQPREALALARAALHAVPEDDGLRKLAEDQYRRVYGDTPGFEAILESSGLSTGRAARAALRVLDFCLALEVGDTLISRLDDRVVEVVEVDRPRGLFTLRRDDRTTTIPAREVVREYERIDPNDFRVLRQLYPDRLAELIERDPVALVIGLINAHGEQIDADQLKHELVPAYIAPQAWSKWWTRTRNLLKRSPHVLIEGRSPYVLRYSAEGVTLEEEIWQAFQETADPETWRGLLERYFRELKARKENPDEKLLQRCRARMAGHVGEVGRRRPAEGLAAALVLAYTGEAGREQSRVLVRDVLADADDPARILAGLKSEALWTAALALLPEVRPDDWADCVIRVFPRAPAAVLDHLVAAARRAGRTAELQRHIDDALAEPISHPETLYWLWKGPADPTGLNLPPDHELFRTIFDTIVALESTLSATPQASRLFRNRMKAAFSLKDAAKVCEQVSQTSHEAAVTLRQQLDRLEGLGATVRARMLDTLRTAHPELWVKRVEHVEPWAREDVIWATQAGIERKTAERDELVNVKMHENAKRIGEAASHGDLSENSEYKFALEERDFLRARLARLNQDLSMARPLSPEDVPTDHVGIGSKVTLRDVAGGDLREMLILGPFETDVEAGVYNYRAPACQQVLGRRIGDHVELSMPGGVRTFEIVAIENGLAGWSPAAGDAGTVHRT